MAVLRLYSRRSGAQDFTVEERRPQKEWEAFRRSMLRYMRETGILPEVIDKFEKTSFELWRGTNVFSDPFDVLYATVPAKKHAESDWSAFILRYDPSHVNSISVNIMWKLLSIKAMS